MHPSSLSGRVAVIATLGVASALAAPRPAVTDTIVLGTSAAFTGPSRDLGIELYRGARAWFEHVNRLGGVHGRVIRLEVYDDGYDPDPAVSNTLQLLRKDGVRILFNYVGTPTVTRVLPLLKRFETDHVLLFFPFTGAEPHRQPPYAEHVFNLRPSYRQEAAELVKLFLALGRSKIAVFYQIDAYGRSGWDGVRRALAVHDRRIHAEATYRRGTPFDASMAAQVRIIQESGADAVISIGAYEACAAFIRDARNAGFRGPIANVSFVGSESLLALLQGEEAATGRDYTFNLVNSQVVPSYEDTSIPAVREYRRSMDQYQPALPPRYADPAYVSPPYSFVSFEGFLNAKVITAILEHVGPFTAKVDTSTLREVIYAMGPIDIGLGEQVDFGPGRHQALETVYFTTVHEGLFVPIRDDWLR